MLIIGLTGTLCSGKNSIAEYLQMCYGFQVINLDSMVLFPDLSSNVDSESQFRDAHDVYREEVAKFVLRVIEEKWTSNFVIFPITLPIELSVFRQKTFFMLVGVDGPLLKRYEHYKKKYSKYNQTAQEFAILDDKINYGLDEYPSSVYQCIYKADKVLLNCSDREGLYNQLRALDVLNVEHLRPSWDTYFVRLAELASTRSNCMKRPIGALVVRQNRIVATGYNGTPYGTTNCNEGGCARCNSGAAQGEQLELCMCVHAESNAILHAGRALTLGSTLYTTTFPCLVCAKVMVQAGISRMVFHKPYDSIDSTTNFMLQAGVEVDQHSPVVPMPSSIEDSESGAATPGFLKEYSKSSIK